MTLIYLFASLKMIQGRGTHTGQEGDAKEVPHVEQVTSGSAIFRPFSNQVMLLSCSKLLDAESSLAGFIYR